jgi:hypothetical protein
MAAMAAIAIAAIAMVMDAAMDAAIELYGVWRLRMIMVERGV